MAECFVGGGKKDGRYGWSRAPISVATGLNILSVPNNQTFYYSEYIGDDYLLINPQSITAKSGTAVPANVFVALSTTAMVTYYNKYQAPWNMADYLGNALYINNDYTNGATAQLISVGSINGCVVSDNSGEYPANGAKGGNKYVAVVT